MLVDVPVYGLQCRSSSLLDLDVDFKDTKLIRQQCRAYA